MLKAVVAILLLACLASAYGTSVSVHTPNTYHVNVRTPHAQIDRILKNLKAGDVLEFAAGIYTNLKLDLSGLVGSVDAYITLRGFGAVIKTGGSVSPITVGACAFVKVEGFSISTTGARNIAAIKFKRGVLNVELLDLVIVSVNGHGIDISNVDDIVNVVIERCDISHVGKVSSSLGVAIIVGGVRVAVKNVANIRIVDNVVHDIASKAAAIQVLLGVVAPQVVKNVVYNVEAALWVVTGIVDDVLDLLPRVLQNLVLDVNVGITIGAGSQCVNNIVANVAIGINVVLGGRVTVLANTTVAHNTVYKVSKFCLQIVAGLPDVTLVIVNNAFAVGEGVLGKVLNIVDGVVGSVATILNNVVQGVLNLDLDLDLDLSLGHKRQGNGPLGLGFLGVALNELFGGLSEVTDELQLLPLEPLVNQLLTVVEDVVDQVGDIVSELLENVQQIVDNLVPNLKQLLGALGLDGLLDPVLDSVQDIVDDLIPDLEETVDDLLDGVEDLIPVLQADLAPLLDGTLDEVLEVLGNVLGTLGNTLENVLGALGKKKRDSNLNLLDLTSTVKNALDLVIHQVPGEVGEKLSAVDNTLSNILDGILDGSVINVVLTDLDNVAGLQGLLSSVIRLVEELLTAVDELLYKLLGSVNGVVVDFGGVVRVGRLTIGARQAGAETYPTLGSYKLKLQHGARA